jgi:murein DD-endopeptidase MepM/ murein hydrolase activator NlpD
VVFFDYNGNGIYDEHEPPIQDATVQVGDLAVTSASDGSYALEAVPKGKQAIRVSAEGFRYISLSLEAFQPSDRALSLTIDSDTRRDWGLMEGFLTIPFEAGTYITQQYSYFDLDSGPGIRDWCNSGVTMNGHIGVRDYGLYEGTELVAAAPGIITEAVGDWQNSSDPSIREDGNRVFIDHGYGLETIYAHLLQVLVQEGSRVSRGQIIGYSGNTGTASGAPHLHFQLNRNGRPIDAYRDPQNPESLCYWTKDNDPQYPPGE